MVTTIIDPTRQRASFRMLVAEYSEFGSLAKYLALRDFRLRYRHASLGALWVVLQPLLPMLIFTGVFGRVLKPSTGGIPYSLFALAGLVPWSFFSTSVARSCLVFVSSGNLLTKVYFPRAILPASSILGNVIDLGVGCLLAAGYSIWNGYFPTWRWLLLPAVALQCLLVAFFVSLALATLNALFRDVKHAMQFLMQLWMYASPVAYSSSLVPEKYRWLVGVNPMTSVLDGFRWSLFGTRPNFILYCGSVASLAVIAAGAIWLFQRFEESLAERV
jgi:lipopolysaccharide transport system permease protein